jgi:hypothetical protein
MPGICPCRTELVLGAQYNAGHYNMFEKTRGIITIAIKCEPTIAYVIFFQFMQSFDFSSFLRLQRKGCY